MTEAELIAALHDIRLPELGLRALIAAVFAATGIGFLVAGLAGYAVAPLTRRATSPPDTARRVAELRGLPDSARQVALLKLLAEVAPDRAQELDPYRAGGLPDAAHLEAEVLRHA